MWGGEERSEAFPLLRDTAATIYMRAKPPCCPLAAPRPSPLRRAAANQEVTHTAGGLHGEGAPHGEDRK